MSSGHIRPDEIDAFIAHYIEHFDFALAARQIGRARSSMERYFKRNPIDNERFEDAKAAKIDELESRTYKVALSGLEPTLTMKFLAAHRAQYRDKSTIDHTNSDGSLAPTDMQLAARFASLITEMEQRQAKGEVITVEAIDVPALPAPKLEDLL